MELRTPILSMSSILGHVVYRQRLDRSLESKPISFFLRHAEGFVTKWGERKGGTLYDVLKTVLSKKVVDNVLAGEDKLEDIVEPKGDCAEEVTSLSDWFLTFAIGARNMAEEAKKYKKMTKEEYVIREITKRYLERVVGNVVMFHLRKLLLAEVRNYIKEKMEELGITDSTAAVKTLLDEPVGKELVEKALSKLENITDAIAWDVATVINVLIWLALNPGRALILSAYFRDKEGDAWALDVVAERIGWYVWRYLGVCPKEEGINLVVLGESSKKIDNVARFDVLVSPSELDLFNFINSYKPMNFPCATRGKKSQTRIALAQELLKAPEQLPVMLEDQHTYVSSTARSSPVHVHFYRPACGKLPSYLARGKKKSKEKVLKLLALSSLRRLAEEIPDNELYYAVALKTYRNPSPSELARLQSKLAVIDTAGLKEGQAEALREVISSMILYNGAILKARTGWGKTVVASRLIENVLLYGEQLFGRKISKVVFVTKASLVEQAKSEIKRFCRTCSDSNVSVVSYDKLYRAISKYEKANGQLLTVESFEKYLKDMNPYAYQVYKTKGIDGWLKMGGIYQYYQILRDYFAARNAHPPAFRYQFSVRAMSDEWLSTISKGGNFDEAEFAGILTNEDLSKPLDEEDVRLLRAIMDADVIIFDEVHELRQMSKLKILEVNKTAIRVGLSATPQHLYSVENIELLKANIGPVVIGREEEEIEVGASAEEGEPEGRRIEIEMIHAPGMNTRKVETYWHVLANSLFSNPLTEQLFKEAGEGKKKVLILTRYIKGADAFAREFERAFGYKLLVIADSPVPRGELKNYDLKPGCLKNNEPTAVAKCMKSGTYLATASRLGTGWNDPELDAIILALPMIASERNVNNLIQIIGRSMRFAPGKSHKLIVLVCPSKEGTRDKKYFTCNKEAVETTIAKELESYMQ